jgi:hypothetical protein
MATAYHLVHENEWSMRATRLIRKGETILREAPRLAAHATMGYNTCVWALVHQALEQQQHADHLLEHFNVYNRKVLDHLPFDEDDARDLRALSKRFPRERVVALYQIMVVYNIAYRHPSAHGIIRGHGFYDTLGRVNHSCQPNAMLIDTGGNGGKALCATCDINPGEEICFAYATVTNLDAMIRRAILRTEFGFECQCVLCSKQKIC